MSNFFALNTRAYRWLRAACQSAALAIGISCAVAQAADVVPPDLQHLSRAQALQLALQFNHDVRLAELALQNASAAGVTAAARPNPMLTVQSFNINPKAGLGSGGLASKTVDSTVRIDQLIERGGKRNLRIENAAQLQRAARFDAIDSRRQLQIGVAQAYIDLQAATLRAELLHQTATLFDGTLRAAQVRGKAGDIAPSEVARLQVDALRAQNDATQADADANRARQGLALLLGVIDQASAIELADGWPADDFSAPEPDVNAVAQRADVLAAQARIDAAVAARNLAAAARSRDITVGVQAEHWPVSATNVQGSGNSFGIALQMPLFVNYHFDGEIRAAEIAIDNARENFAKLRDQAHSDLKKAWHDARAALERVRRYDDGLLPATKKSADAAEFAFRHGALNVLDVLDARRTLRAVQLEALATRADFAKALAVWEASFTENSNQ